MKLFTLASNGRRVAMSAVREASSESMDRLVGGSLVKDARKRRRVLTHSLAIAIVRAPVTIAILTSMCW